MPGEPARRGMLQVGEDGAVLLPFSPDGAVETPAPELLFPSIFCAESGHPVSSQGCIRSRCVSVVPVRLCNELRDSSTRCEMRTWIVLCLLLLQYDSTTAPKTAGGGAVPASHTPSYTADGRMMFPADYREWVY